MWLSFRAQRVGVCNITKILSIHFGACTTQRRNCIEAILCVQQKRKLRARKKLTKKREKLHHLPLSFPFIFIVHASARKSLRAGKNGKNFSRSCTLWKVQYWFFKSSLLLSPDIADRAALHVCTFNFSLIRVVQWLKGRRQHFLSLSNGVLERSFNTSANTGTGRMQRASRNEEQMNLI